MEFCIEIVKEYFNLKYNGLIKNKQSLKERLTPNIKRKCTIRKLMNNPTSKIIGIFAFGNCARDASATWGDHSGPQKPTNLKQTLKNLFLFDLFPPEENFDIDAGDGGGRGGPFRTQDLQTS